MCLSKPSSWQLRISSMLAVSAMYCMVRLGMSLRMQASAQLGTEKERRQSCGQPRPRSPPSPTTHLASRTKRMRFRDHRSEGRASDNREWDRLRRRGGRPLGAATRPSTQCRQREDVSSYTHDEGGGKEVLKDVVRASTRCVCLETLILSPQSSGELLFNATTSILEPDYPQSLYSHVRLRLEATIDALRFQQCVLFVRYYLQTISSLWLPLPRMCGHALMSALADGIPPWSGQPADPFHSGIHMSAPTGQLWPSIPFGRIRVRVGVRVCVLLSLSLCGLIVFGVMVCNGVCVCVCVLLLSSLLLLLLLLLLYLRPHKTIRVLRSHETNPNDVVHIQFPQQVARCIELKTVVDCQHTCVCVVE